MVDCITLAQIVKYRDSLETGISSFWAGGSWVLEDGIGTFSDGFTWGDELTLVVSTYMIFSSQSGWRTFSSQGPFAELVHGSPSYLMSLQYLLLRGTSQAHRNNQVDHCPTIPLFHLTQ
jgi:hypothetical protein